VHRITFVATSRLPASAEAVFDWHEAPGAFERLTPPGERVRVAFGEIDLWEVNVLCRYAGK
jgi:ligand-binding SRPBCC domain-containing protein